LIPRTLILSAALALAVITDHSLGNVWQRSGGSANYVERAEHLAWMPRVHRLRQERMRQARLLFGGAHRQYFLDEKRSGHTFKPLADGGEPFYQPYNLLGLVSRKTADLLFGESPRIYVDDATTQEAVDQIVDRSWLFGVLLDAATEASWAGGSYLEITRHDGQAYVGHAPAQEVYAEGRAGPDRQHASYVRYATTEVAAASGTGVDRLLLVTRYATGRIERELYKLDRVDASGLKATGREPIERWPERRDGQPLLDAEATGLSRPSIVWVPNEYNGTSDYDGLIDAQDALNAKHTQIARILARHSDPALIAGEDAADEDGNLRFADGVLYERDGPGKGVRYLTWDGQLDAAQQDRNFALSALATQAEMPLSLLGVKDDATAETAQKMRLQASNALAKAQRKAVTWREAIRLALSLAVEAEIGRPPPPDKSLGVEMRDGLPDDEESRANVIATLRAAGVLSIDRGLELQYLDPQSKEEEKSRLATEHARTTPSVLFGEPGEAGETDEVDPLADEPTRLEEAGIDAGQTLNGAQITAVLSVLDQLRKGQVEPATAVELLVAVGLDRDRAQQIVTAEASKPPAANSTPAPTPDEDPDA
jgi:hypothetical protein